MSFWEERAKTSQKKSAHEMANEMNGAAINGGSMTYNTAVNNTVTLDEEALQEFQEDPNIDLFEEEEDDTLAIMSDANLRLEQGRLYQMVLQGDIFADTNADPKAIRKVQLDIRKFVRERMETMLGIRQEQPAQAAV